MTRVLASEIPKGDIVGPYAWDHASNPDDPRLNRDPLGIKEARGDGNIAMHNSNLFDEEELDEATGIKPATRFNDNPYHEFEASDLSIFDAVSAEHEKRRPIQLDAAELWLIKNDPSYQFRKSK